MKYQIQHIANICQAQLQGESAPTRVIEYLSIDSRNLAFAEKTLFVALQGQRNDGHVFINNLYQQGVRCFLVAKVMTWDDFPEATFLYVTDTLRAMQVLAAWHRQQYQYPIIGITGSNGKTIVKEWLYQLLQYDYPIVRSPRSYNSQVGVALSLYQMNETHRLGIFEAGISTTHEMSHLADMIQCNIGILTNIGEAHSQGFRDENELRSEKIQLFTYANIVICKLGDSLHPSTYSLEKRFFTWGNEGSDLIVKNIIKKNNNSHIQAAYLQNDIDINIPFTDDASIENAIHCWATMLYLGIKNELIQQRMLRLRPIAMRLEIKAGINQCLIVNDSYNADFESLRIAMDFVAQQSSALPRTLILSDILQARANDQELYEPIARLIIEKKFQRIIGIGQHVTMLQTYLPSDFQQVYYESLHDFLYQIPFTTFEKEVILIKGARIFELDRVAERLAQKAHKTTLEINLNALIHNLNVYRNLLQKGVRLMAMVKASAYGNGSTEVAKLLAFHGVDYLAVAYADEGIELRNAGIKLPILVLNPTADSFDAMARYHLEPEIYSLALLREYILFANGYEQLSIHLKLDTGMHRLGFESNDMDSLNELLLANNHIKVKSIFSHLASSEAAQDDAFTQQQFDTFQILYQKISTTIGYKPLRHILNSGGITRFPTYQMDMVRLGIGLYGIDSGQQIQSQLQAVQTLKASISQIKNIPKGETIGYNRRGIANENMRIATISIGYADGLSRLAGNAAYSVQVAGAQAPIVGSVCMDMTMIDISNIPAAQEGNEVIIFGQTQAIQTLAKCCQTIPYEILTGINDRVKRVYYQE